MPIKIAVLASGSGSNFEAIVKACINNEIDGVVKLLICDRKDAFCFKRAANNNIDSIYLNPKNFDSKELFEAEIAKILKQNGIDLICLAGYMRIVTKRLLDDFSNKIINIHPALLPSFKGNNAIIDAFNYGVKVTGVTVHFVDEGIDSGKIIAQTAVNIEESDTLDTLEDKIHKAEHTLYVKAINLFINDKMLKSELCK